MCGHDSLRDVQIIDLLDHPDVALRLGRAARETVVSRFTTEVSSTSYELLYRCLRHCGHVSNLNCARRCAGSVAHCVKP